MVQWQQEVLWEQIVACQMEVDLGQDILKLAPTSRLIPTLSILQDHLKPSSSNSRVKDRQ